MNSRVNLLCWQLLFGCKSFFRNWSLSMCKILWHWLVLNGNLVLSQWHKFLQDKSNPISGPHAGTELHLGLGQITGKCSRLINTKTVNMWQRERKMSTWLRAETKRCFFHFLIWTKKCNTDLIQFSINSSTNQHCMVGVTEKKSKYQFTTNKTNRWLSARQYEIKVAFFLKPCVAAQTTAWRTSYFQRQNTPATFVSVWEWIHARVNHRVKKISRTSWKASSSSSSAASCEFSFFLPASSPTFLRAPWPWPGPDIWPPGSWCVGLFVYGSVSISEKSRSVSDTYAAASWASLHSEDSCNAGFSLEVEALVFPAEPSST